MLRLPALTISRGFLATASVVTLALGLAGTTGTAAAETVTLDNFTSTSKDGDVLTIKHADFEGTNLTKQEIEKIFSSGETDDEKTALVQKFKVDKMSIPAIDVAPKKGGAIHIHDVTAAKVDAGKIGALGISGIDGSGVDKDGAVAIKAGALKVENADLTTALAAATHSGDTPAMSQLGSFSWQNVDLTIPEAEGAPADKTIHLALASVEIHNNYDGAVFRDGAATIKGFVVEPSKTSDMAASLGILGYTRLELGMTSTARYDAGAKTMTIDDLTFNGDKMGALALKGNFGGVGPEIFGTDNDARMAGLIGGNISALQLKFTNSGLFEKAVGYFADQQKMTPEQLKAQWTQVAGQMLPAVLGGSPPALKLAGAAQKFIASPTSLTIDVKPKAGALKFADVMSLADPSTLLTKVDITATPGQ